MDEAKVVFQHGRFEIAGPLQLQLAINLALGKPVITAQDGLDLNARIYNVLKDWYVYCSVTKEKINLTDLHYWDVEKQLAFKDVEVAVKYGHSN